MIDESLKVLVELLDVVLVLAVKLQYLLLAGFDHETVFWAYVLSMLIQPFPFFV